MVITIASWNPVGRRGQTFSKMHLLSSLHLGAWSCSILVHHGTWFYSTLVHGPIPYWSILLHGPIPLCSISVHGPNTQTSVLTQTRLNCDLATRKSDKYVTLQRALVGVPFTPGRLSVACSYSAGHPAIM